MATAPSLPLVSAEEYLRTAYRPDVEFVDGVLLERSVPTIPHSALQILLAQYFLRWQRSMSFLPLAEVRTKIIEGARYRIPDLLLCPKPLPKGGVVDVVPPVVIEILSPTDTVSGTLQRFRDYASLGVSTIVQMDPERYVAHRYETGSLIETQFTQLYLPHVDAYVPFDSDELLAQLRAELGDIAPE